MSPNLIAAMIAATLQSAPVAAQTMPASDPSLGFGRLFGLGGHACKQYDDTERLLLYSKAAHPFGIVSWIQRSANGTKANVPMPRDLAAALAFIPGLPVGKTPCGARQRLKPLAWTGSVIKRVSAASV